MPNYSTGRRKAVVAKLLTPRNLSVREVAQQEGISEPTLHKWRKEAREQESEMDVADAFAFPQGSVVVFDRGYSRYTWHKQLTERGIFWVNLVDYALARPARCLVPGTRRQRYLGQRHAREGCSMRNFWASEADQ